ncbi:kinesin-II 95 kDa subunit [Thecamonas trahens ATCC 50062]|uniref:Kinesin-like protein n=1 Tax=Thecamonas trahens ATCC 50062 TaxID=461836 RepID=A0A0L0DI06_THETB|nr:kinesin-II 95 kDa subunit [Thecamonas trahens ATCC 50062]KNC51999.1 kinesin-II 95 kDa subunit [Thecamonas trahens ATCC 50062]|eukprot:XP_013755583.1 kinesin-II 95 kDa subunit [Thecamonas trahens ATCC 50062]
MQASLMLLQLQLYACLSLGPVARHQSKDKGRGKGKGKDKGKESRGSKKVTVKLRPPSDERVRVVVRCRPLGEKEVTDGRNVVVEVDSTARTVAVYKPDGARDPHKVFTFDATYGPDATQLGIYEESARPIIEAALGGYNGTIFAYGQTGTGKTFTMEGVFGDKALRGIIPNAFHHIFQHIGDSVDQQYLVRASYLEIYNEDIRDLLSKNYTRKLALKEHPDSGVYVKDLSAFVVKSFTEIERVMAAGKKHRVTGATNMNAQSSRSHSVFTITIECSELGPDGDTHVRVGKLNLVDLAGSERQSKTGAAGDRLKEGININVSLSCLGNVIAALADGKTRHIPYRDSKLTRLLQDSLGGNSKTVMMANVGPADYNFEETMSTLRWANRAKNIKNKPKINEDPKDAMLRQFQEEIEALKAQLSQHGVVPDGGDSAAAASGGIDVSQARIQEMQAQLEAEKARLAADRDMVDSEKAKIAAELEARAVLLEDERKEQEALAARLAAMQDKVLSGGTEGLIDLKEKQERELEEQRLRLERQAREEERLKKELEAQAEEAELSKKKFSSLEEEAAIKTRKLKKLWSKLQNAKGELSSLEEEHAIDRLELMEEIRTQNDELKLFRCIINNFVPPTEAHKVQQRALWDDDADDYVLKPVDVTFDRELKRPAARPGEKRPLPDYALRALQQGATNPRFRVENILQMELAMPKRTTVDYVGSSVPDTIQDALDQALAGEDELELRATEALPSL